jgi:hypothetical protein
MPTAPAIPRFVGVEAAAPLFFSIVDAVRASDPAVLAEQRLPPRGPRAGRGVPRERRPAERLVPRARQHLVHSRQVADPA